MVEWNDVSLDVTELARSDVPYVLDVVAALVAADRMGAHPAGITTAAVDYRPAAHRRQVVGSRAGVTYVDDSKATNPHAALAAVGSFDSVVLIAGGRNKGLDLTGLASAPNVKALVTMGEAAGELEGAATVSHSRASSMDEAVALATELAAPGDTVLLAPGCASFDMFENYGTRGDAFVEAVRRQLEAG